MPSHYDWPKVVWQNPLPHDFTFGFGLSMDGTMAAKQSTIVPKFFQDNAIVDYETIKTNPENADFAVSARPNCAAGSYIPKCMMTWKAYIRSTEVDMASFKTMNINTSMLNRLDAFDKKTGNDIETILELQHETTDEQAGALYNTTKLFEGHSVNDLHTDVPFLATNGQLEGVVFDQELYFDALHYYTNKEMLRMVTERMKRFRINAVFSDPVPMKDKMVSDLDRFVPSHCKYQHPYTYCGKLFHLPLVGTHDQPTVDSSTSATEHVTFLGRVRFNEYNPDFNFARA